MRLTVGALCWTDIEAFLLESLLSGIISLALMWMRVAILCCCPVLLDASAGFPFNMTPCPLHPCTLTIFAEIRSGRPWRASFTI